jgi:small-conductance mechanosensitive channel
MVEIPGYLYTPIYVAVILAVTWIAARLLRLAVGGVLRQSNPQVALGAQRLVGVLVWVVGATLALQELGLSVQILLLVVGLGGIAAILALREQLENAGAKYFSDVYSPFKVGDQIRLREHQGKVLEINAMTTVLLTPEDHLVSLPNSLFMREPVVNESPQAWRELTIPISVPGSVDLAEFESEVLKRLGKLRFRLDRRFPPVIATRARSPQNADLAITVIMRRPEDREPLIAEINGRVAEALQQVRSGSRPIRPPATSPTSPP